MGSCESPELETSDEFIFSFSDEEDALPELTDCDLSESDD